LVWGLDGLRGFFGDRLAGDGWLRAFEQAGVEEAFGKDS